MEREIAFYEKKIVDLVTMLNDKALLIPPFQREFVWEPEDVLKLWESIFRFYPIGSLLSWETPVYLSIHRRAGGRILQKTQEKDSGTRKWLYLLDGQQRATALLVSLHGEKAQVRQTHDFDYTLYFDASDASFFFENTLKRRSRSVDPALLIRMKDLFENGEEALSRVLGDPRLNGTIESNLRRLVRIFTDYKIPLIHIRGFDIPDVREIFERINQEGKDLKSLDVMIARTFRNYDYLVEEDLR